MNRFLYALIAAALFATELLYGGAGEGAANEILNANAGAAAEGAGGVASCRLETQAALQTNPAGLAFLTNPEIVSAHDRNFFEIKRTFFGFTKPLAARPATWAAGLSVLRDEHIWLNFTNPDGSLKESRWVRAREDYLFILSYSQMFGKNVSAGLNTKLLQSTLAGRYKAAAYALDTGLLFRSPAGRITYGLSARNIGTGLKYIEEEDELQREFVTGFSLCLLNTNEHALSIMGDCVVNEKRRTHAGLEYVLHKRLVLRGGYKFGYDLDTFTAGFGLSAWNMDFDYAFVENRIFDSSQFVSMRIRFEGVSRYNAGLRYFSRGMSENAISEWLQVPRGHPDFEKAQERINDARRHLLAAEIYGRGENLLKAEKYEEALSEFDKVKKIFDDYADAESHILFIKSLRPANLKSAILEMEKELVEAERMGFEIEAARAVSSRAYGAFLWNNYKSARENVQMFREILNAAYKSGVEQAIAEVKSDLRLADKQDVDVPDAYRRFGEIKRLFAVEDYKTAKTKANQFAALIASRLKLNQDVVKIVGATAKRGIEAGEVEILARFVPTEDLISAEKFYEMYVRGSQATQRRPKAHAAESAPPGGLRASPRQRVTAPRAKASAAMPTTKGKTLSEIEQEMETADAIRQKLELLGDITGATVKRGVEIEKVTILARARSLGFQGKSAIISAEGRALLHDIGKLIRASRPKQVRVLGHRYDMGDTESNKRISLAQAEAVKDHYVAKENISADIIEAVGMGDAQPNGFRNDFRLDSVETVFVALREDLQVSQLNKLNSREDVSLERSAQSVETLIFASEKAVSFEPGSGEIKDNSLLLLDRICDVLEILPECEVTIIAGGKGADGDGLFFQRAEEVLQYFVKGRKLPADNIRLQQADFREESGPDGFRSDELIISLRWEYQ